MTFLLHRGLALIQVRPAPAPRSRRRRARAHILPRKGDNSSGIGLRQVANSEHGGPAFAHRHLWSACGADIGGGPLVVVPYGGAALRRFPRLGGE